MIGPNGVGKEDDEQNASVTAHFSFSRVFCDKDFPVTALNVFFLPLFGTLPREIAQLSNLVNHTIASDNLAARLPLEMANSRL